MYMNGMMQPIIVKPIKGRILVRFPWNSNNREWLSNICSNRIVWNKKEQWWEIARSHYRKLIEALSERFGTIEIVEHYSILERCWASCLHAHGWDCVCSCMGKNHQAGHLYDGWTEIQTPLFDGGPMYIKSDVVVRSFQYTSLKYIEKVCETLK